MRGRDGQSYFGLVIREGPSEEVIFELTLNRKKKPT